LNFGDPCRPAKGSENRGIAIFPERSQGKALTMLPQRFVTYVAGERADFAVTGPTQLTFV